jgi:hypothetical protein
MHYTIRFSMEGNIQIHASDEFDFVERTKSTNCIVARKDSTAIWMCCRRKTFLITVEIGIPASTKSH